MDMLAFVYLLMSSDDTVTKGDSLLEHRQWVSASKFPEPFTYLARNFSDHTRQVMLLQLTCFPPRRKPAHFSIVAVISQEHFRANQDDLLVQEDYATIVLDILVDHWPKHRAGKSHYRDINMTRSAHIPTSTSIPLVFSSVSSFAKTSHECRYVSP